MLTTKNIKISHNKIDELIELAYQDVLETLVPKSHIKRLYNRKMAKTIEKLKSGHRLVQKLGGYKSTGAALSRLASHNFFKDPESKSQDVKDWVDLNDSPHQKKKKHKQKASAYFHPATAGYQTAVEKILKKQLDRADPVFQKIGSQNHVIETDPQQLKRISYISSRPNFDQFEKAYAVYLATSSPDRDDREDFRSYLQQREADGSLKNFNIYSHDPLYYDTRSEPYHVTYNQNTGNYENTNGYAGGGDDNNLIRAGVNKNGVGFYYNKNILLRDALSRASKFFQNYELTNKQQLLEALEGRLVQTPQNYTYNHQINSRGIEGGLRNVANQATYGHAVHSSNAISIAPYDALDTLDKDLQLMNAINVYNDYGNFLTNYQFNEHPIKLNYKTSEEVKEMNQEIPSIRSDAPYDFNGKGDSDNAYDWSQSSKIKNRQQHALNGNKNPLKIRGNKNKVSIVERVHTKSKLKQAAKRSAFVKQEMKMMANSVPRVVNLAPKQKVRKPNSINLSSSLPAAVGFGMQQKARGPTITKFIIDHEELIQDVYGTTTWQVNQMPFNPGLANIYSYLGAWALLFDAYKLHGLRHFIKPNTPTTISGSLQMVYDYDPGDPNPVGQKDMFNMQDCTITDAWHTNQAIYKPKRTFRFKQKYLVRTTNIFQGSTLADSDPCELFWATNNFPNLNAIGKMCVSYRVEFFNPHPTNSASNFNAIWSSPNDGSTAYVQATTPWSNTPVAWTQNAFSNASIYVGPAAQGSPTNQMFFNTTINGALVNSQANQSNSVAPVALTAKQFAICVDGIYDMEITLYNATAGPSVGFSTDAKLAIIGIPGIGLTQATPQLITLATSNGGSAYIVKQRWQILGTTPTSPSVVTINMSGTFGGTTNLVCQLRQVSPMAALMPNFITGVPTSFGAVLRQMQDAEMREMVVKNSSKDEVVDLKAKLKELTEQFERQQSLLNTILECNQETDDEEEKQNESPEEHIVKEAPHKLQVSDNESEAEEIIVKDGKVFQKILPPLIKRSSAAPCA